MAARGALDKELDAIRERLEALEEAFLKHLAAEATKATKAKKASK